MGIATDDKDLRDHVSEQEEKTTFGDLASTRMRKYSSLTWLQPAYTEHIPCLNSDVTYNFRKEILSRYGHLSSSNNLS